MALSSLLETYLSLEQRMLSLDAREDAGAEAVRDAMDLLWYRLSDKDRETLDSRRTIADADTPCHGDLDAVWCRVSLGLQTPCDALLLMSPPVETPSSHDRPVAKGSKVFPREAA